MKGASAQKVRGRHRIDLVTGYQIHRHILKAQLGELKHEEGRVASISRINLFPAVEYALSILLSMGLRSDGRSFQR